MIWSLNFGRCGSQLHGGTVVNGRPCRRLSARDQLPDHASYYKDLGCFVMNLLNNNYPAQSRRISSEFLRPRRLSIRWYSARFCRIINNYWMRLSYCWIIKTEVCVICQSRRLRQITQARGFDNSWYHAKTEFNNCFIIHFHIIHPQKQKRSVRPFCFREHSKGLNNQADVELDMINAISAADIAFIMSSSQAIVNWLNALDQSDFS